mmetsp:Transcript_34202/g.80557  ORF Transcript_34202/g.80557 Transcript_34202/m.80557 type:complete len:200 (+) Transcript_34202:4156-4755(+)
MSVASSSAILRTKSKSCSKTLRSFASDPPATVMKICSVMGSLSRGSFPNMELLTGTRLQPTVFRPLSLTKRSTIALQSLIAVFVSLPGGKKTLPTAYSPMGGSSAPNNSWAFVRMKESGIPKSIPAPSPEAGSQPHPPRWAMRTNISSATSTTCLEGIDFMLAIKPTPQLSFSSFALYNTLSVFGSSLDPRNFNTCSVV